MKTIAGLLNQQATVSETGVRRLTGIATHETPDRLGDIVLASGITSEPEIPLLFEHDHKSVIGRARLGTATKTGTPFTAELPRVTEPGPLRERIETAWLSVKHGLIRACSIGFRPIDGELMPNGGIRFLRCEILELSLVCVPAHPKAQLDAIKSARAAMIRRLSTGTTRHATNDRTAHRQMVEAMYRDDPRLAELRRQRRQIDAAAARQRDAWIRGWAILD